MATRDPGGNIELIQDAAYWMDASLPLPIDSVNHSFVWGTGIEDTFVPHARPGLRALDEYELAQHYEQWKSDFDLVAETGVKAARWGIPWYKVQPKPDLMENSFISCCYPQAVAEYAAPANGPGKSA